MKSPFLRAAGILSLLAVSGYVALSALPLFLGRPETALLYYERVYDTVPVYGVFLRHELVLPASDELLCFDEGEKLPAGTLTEKGGIFTRHLDGFEHLQPPALDTDSIRSLCADRREAVSSPGKIISGSAFSFYALMDAPSAKRLSIGQAVSLETDYWGGVELTLVEKGEQEGEFTPLLFQGSSGMDTVMYLRQVSGRLLLGSHTGLRAPERAVGYDRDGPYVLSLSLGQTEKIPVAVAHDGEGYKLITSPRLYEGSEVIIGGT